MYDDTDDVEKRWYFNLSSLYLSISVNELHRAEQYFISFRVRNRRWACFMYIFIIPMMLKWQKVDCEYCKSCLFKYGCLFSVMLICLPSICLISLFWCLHPVAYRLWSQSGYVGLLEKQNFVRKINYFLITILTSERAKKGKKVSTWKVFDGNWWQFLVKNDRGKNWPQLQSKLWRQRSVTPRCIYLQMSVKSFSKSIGRHWLS